MTPHPANHYTSNWVEATSAAPATRAIRLVKQPLGAFVEPKLPTEHQRQQHLVLIGGGHAHVQVIKALNAEARPNNLKVTLIDAQASASYSGMVPGSIAGFYKPEETQLHLEPLAKWAGMEFVEDKVVDIDVDRKLVYLQSSSQPIPYDAVSIDIGSTSRDVDRIPGAREFTIPTRPIHRLVQRLDAARDELADQPPRLVVVGGGAAGVELSMAVTTRWQESHPDMTCELLDAGDELLPGESLAARHKLRSILDSKGIRVRHGCDVQEVTEGCVVLRGGDSVPFTHCIWATGAGAHPLAHRLNNVRGLAADKYTWLEVGPDLQSTSHSGVFAAGDCATITGLEHGPPPKAGVYAVRAGPVLIENLTRYLDGRPMTKYEPQDDFLKLLVCGNRKALGFRFGLALHGEWVWQLKDHIDRKFMDLFDVKKLPKTRAGKGQYDTSQYDAQDDQEEVLMDAEEAAQLLQRESDVDYMVAWRTLRRMARDEDYRDSVLSYIHQESSVVA